jgi:hypothetical protein
MTAELLETSVPNTAGAPYMVGDPMLVLHQKAWVPCEVSHVERVQAIRFGRCWLVKFAPTEALVNHDPIVVVVDHDGCFWPKPGECGIRGLLDESC